MTDNAGNNKAQKNKKNIETFGDVPARQTRALPTSTALKKSFKAGSIPLESDFADLIDLANMGRQAVGGEEGQAGPAEGFTLSSTGRLELKPNTAKGISVDKDGVAIKSGNGILADSLGVNIKLAKGNMTNGGGGDGEDESTTGHAGGLSLSSGGLSVNGGKGIWVDSDGVSIKLPSISGLTVDLANGLSVGAGNGILADNLGVNVKLAKGERPNGVGQGVDGTTSGAAGGLFLGANGLSVDAGNGICIDTQGVSIKLPQNSGLSVDEGNGLTIVPEQKFYKGMVMMFAGAASEIPKGWALCDGSNNTPNLIDRFILGSIPANSKQYNSASLTGSKNKKSYIKESTPETVTGDITIEGIALKEAQIPSHRHEEGTRWYGSNAASFGFNRYYEDGKYIIDNHVGRTFNGADNVERNLYALGSYGGYYTYYTEITGRSEKHKHGGSMTTNEHKHTTDVMPPYYTLAFIIKL